MIHTDRVFSSSKLESEDELVQAMTNRTWPLCYSFYHDGLLYLNDSDREEDPEYAVVKFDRAEGHHDVIGREVGRIKPKGMDASRVHEFVQDMRAGRWEMEQAIRIVAEPAWHHSCELCRLDEEE
jgi:hypothetical protein